MNNTGHTSSTAGIDVYNRTGNGPCPDQETKAGCHSVGNPLAQDFSVTVMFGAGHIIYYQSGQQRFNSTQQGQSQTGLTNIHHIHGQKIRNLQGRQHQRNLTYYIFLRHWYPQCRNHSTNNDGDDSIRYFFVNQRQYQHHNNGDAAQQRTHFKIFKLIDKNQHADTIGKPNHNRFGNQPDIFAQF